LYLPTIDTAASTSTARFDSIPARRFTAGDVVEFRRLRAHYVGKLVAATLPLGGRATELPPDPRNPGHGRRLRVLR
jgi:hypothetical protein